MFLRSLADKQRRCYLTLAQRLIALDGAFTDEEADLLGEQMEQLELSSSDADPDQELEDLLAPFDDEPSQLRLLCGLLELGHIDGDFSPVEIDFLEQIRDQLGRDDLPTIDEGPEVLRERLEAL